MTVAEAQQSLADAEEAFARMDLERVIAHLSAAIRGFTAAGQPCSAALACARLGQVMADCFGNLTAARAWFGRAERLVENQAPCLEQGWVAVAAMGCDTEDPGALLRRAELAMDRARRFGDLNLETKALADAGLAHVQMGGIELGMAMLDEAMALACGPVDNSDAAARSVCSFFTACYFAMDFERASSWAEPLRQHGLLGPSPGGPLFLSSHCDSVQATLLMELGRWSEAEEVLLRAIADFQAVMGPSWHAAIALADLRTRQGRHAEAEVLLLGKEQSPQAMLPAARLQLVRGDHELAVATARRGLALLRDDRLRVVELLTVIIEGSLAIGDLAAARTACDDLVARLAGVDVAALVARRESARAAVIAAEGDPEAAASVLRAAIDRVDAVVLPWRRAIMLVELAGMLGVAGDARAARDAMQLARAALAKLDVVVPAAAATPVEPTASSGVLVMADGWCTASLRGNTARLRMTKGLAYVAALVATPGVEHHVFDLVDRVEGVGLHEEPDRRSLGDAGALLDGRARSAYRRRIEALRGDIDEALESQSFERAEALQYELDALVAQLAGAFGIGGTARVAGSAAERARLNVTRAIRSALRALDVALPGAGISLDRRIRTGLYCIHEPDPSDAIRWIVQC